MDNPHENEPGAANPDAWLDRPFAVLKDYNALERTLHPCIAWWQFHYKMRSANFTSKRMTPRHALREGIPFCPRCLFRSWETPWLQTLQTTSHPGGSHL
jgi:hypothetical protein